MVERIVEGRTDLVEEHLSAGGSAMWVDEQGVSLIRWCAFYGDVTAVRILLAHGATLELLGDNLDLNGAAFHGHWRLCEFLLDQGAEVNRPLPDTGETPLHAALCKVGWPSTDLVVEVLLDHGADPNLATRPGVETGCFMRDCRTKGETPLHRAAAFAGAETIRRLLDAGADREARDTHGDTPLSWASWYLRPDAILRLLCYGGYSIHPDRRPMSVTLQGRPHSQGR